MASNGQNMIFQPSCLDISNVALQDDSEWTCVKLAGEIPNTYHLQDSPDYLVFESCGEELTVGTFSIRRN